MKNQAEVNGLKGTGMPSCTQMTAANMGLSPGKRTVNFFVSVCQYSVSICAWLGLTAPFGELWACFSYGFLPSFSVIILGLACSLFFIGVFLISL